MHDEQVHPDSAPPDTEPRENARPGSGGLRRFVLLLVGGLATGFGLIGAFLPLLPTTPFLLLALACFSRSSPALQERLLRTRVFGPYLVQWQRERTVPPEAKRKAYGLVIVTFGVSVALVRASWLQGLLVVLACLVAALVARLPSRPE